MSGGAACPDEPPTKADQPHTCRKASDLHRSSRTDCWRAAIGQPCKKRTAWCIITAKHRPIRRNTEDRKCIIVTSVLELEYEGIGTEKAVSQVAVLAGVTPRTVRRALAEPRRAEFRRKVLESIGRLPPKLACRAKSGTAEFVDDYFVRLYLEVMVRQNKADNK
jgi:hypothetical protein